MLRCACLVAEREGAILLVRVRQNIHWYLPGGTIEQGETPEQALVREITEELGLAVATSDLTYLYSVTGPAYGRDGDVMLICFSVADITGATARAEISQLAWRDASHYDHFAPAVQILYDRHIRPHMQGGKAWQNA
jgi:8-oxo-dGTP diphosphatase